MLYLCATLHTLGLKAVDSVDEKVRRDERGSVTIEQVLWAAGVIVVVGIVFAAIQKFVKDNSTFTSPIK